MDKISKTQNPWLVKSAKKKMKYPKINVSSKRSIGKMNGGFDQALLHLGVAITEEEPEVIEE